MAATAVNTIIGIENPYRIATGLAPMVAGTSVFDFSDVVAAGGTMAFTSGADAIVMDAARANYAVQVSASGVTTITDIGSSDATYGQTTTITGESYLVFNGNALAASTVTAYGAPTYPNDMYFVENAASAQLAQFYAAVVQRIPDLGGLEYWENVLTTFTPTLGASGAIAGIANNFLTIIHDSYSTSSPITTLGGDPAAMSNTQFVTALYENILGRQPDSGGLAYWVSEMDSGLSRAQLLVGITNALAVTSTVNAAPGSGWLINYGVTGGYADLELQESASTVVTQAATTHDLNATLINPTTLTSTITLGDFIVAPAQNNVFISEPAVVVTIPGSSGDVVHLSSAVNWVNIDGTNDTVFSASSGQSQILINSNPATNTGGTAMITLTGTGNIVAGIDIGPNYVFGYVPGSDHINATPNSGGMFPTGQVTLNAPMPAAPLAGSTLTFASYLPHYVDVGSVGGTGSAADMAAAADLVYQSAGKTGENAIFYGQNASDTIFWHWTNTHGTAAPVASDMDGNITLIGVQASALTMHDFAQ